MDVFINISVLYTLCDVVYFFLLLCSLDGVFTVYVEYYATAVQPLIMMLPSPSSGVGHHNWYKSPRFTLADWG